MCIRTPPLAFYVCPFLLCFSCPRASASAYTTAFNKCSGHLHFDDSMTPNNPCNPASSVFKPLEETKKRENQIGGFYSGIWVKQKQGSDEEGNAFL